MTSMPPENKSSYVWDIVKFALITLVIVLPIRAYIAQPFVVSGASMDPTFKNGDYLIIDELSYLLRSPKRGEVVVLRYPKDPSKFFIKRVIGLPEEIISVVGGKVSVTKTDGTVEILKEDYARAFIGAKVVKKLNSTEYFVMGDNRPVSLDSRIWGPVPEDLIKGRALIRLLPPKQAAFLPGQN